MDTLDGFIVNLFRIEKPIVEEKDFKDPEIWVCDLLDQNSDLASKYITYRLGNASSKIEKLQILYDCRACFKTNLNSKNETVYKEAIHKVECAIAHYEECKKLQDCQEDDVEFIVGKFSQSYCYPNEFEITKGDETRRYSANRYLNCILENHYKNVDKESSHHKRVYILNKALFQIERLINEFKLQDYEKVIQDCKLVIDFEKEQAKLPIDEISKDSIHFKLSNRRGAKTDVIRILNAIYELKFFEKQDGQIPSKEEFMKQTGNFWGIDLSKYDTDLSQALNNTGLEANLKVFEDMKTITQSNHYISKEKK